MPFLAVLGGCRTATFPVPDDWLSTPKARRVGPVALGSDGQLGSVVAARTGGAPLDDIRIDKRPEGEVLVSGEADLTPPFVSIQSFDVSRDRGEIAFSAKRADNYDVALVAIEGSRINWIPEDPADETDPRWASRGNKFSYVLRRPAGDLVRTIHVLTAYHLTIDFPNSVVNALSWDEASERFAVTYETPDASERVDVMKYGGEERRRAVEPSTRLDYEIEPFESGSLLLRPASMRYNEKLPLIIWLTSARLNSWNDARGALLSSVRAGCIVTTRAPDAAFWNRVAAIQWADPGRVFVVNTKSAPSHAVTISGDASLPAGRYRQSDGTIVVPPAVVESFAVGYLTQELKTK